MSTNKKPDLAKKRLLALKSIGLMTETSARGKLTDSQKRTIKKKWDEYHEIITAPKGSYTKKDVSYYEPKERKALVASGYKIAAGKAFIPNEGYAKATVKRVSNFTTEGKGEFIVIERKTSDGRKTETEFVGTSLQKEGWRAKLLNQYEAGNFEKGDFIGIKIGSGGVFRRVIMHKIDDIFKYVSDDFNPHDPGTDKEMLQEKMVLVKMSVKDYRDLGANERSKKQQNREKNLRQRKRQALGVVKNRKKK
jgi:hypothetical protein